MANILSLQSHVAYGYVGNRAASFSLQRLGHEVITVNTVQFSNHTGYGKFKGDIMSLEHIESIFQGLAELGVLDKLDAILTGYLGNNDLALVLLKWLNQIKINNSELVYCCDPVIGDIGRGIFVQTGVAEFFQNTALNYATILTPNQFELNYLTGIEINTLIDAQRACNLIHQKGVKIILVTSLTRIEASDKQIEMLLSTEEATYLIATPRLDMPVAPNGAGDMTAAIFLAKYLETNCLILSLEHTAAALFATFAQTLSLNRRELALIQAQTELVNPTIKFKALQINNKIISY